METKVMTVDPAAPDANAIEEAAGVLRRGGLVAFPTETVYGLGANALDPAAVASIFAAKGRPANNPVIVHVQDVASARRIVAEWNCLADRLAARFWPGPLTFVLPKAPAVPGVVTGGGETVAVRIPSHPVARALIASAGIPIAAPSANRSNRVSPTQASHVLRGLAGRVDLLLDGGPCPGGIESTVIDLSSGPPRLLRPGLVTATAIEAITGPIERTDTAAGPGPLRSPGMLPRHYAPDASLEVADNGKDRVAALVAAGLRVGWVRNSGVRAFGNTGVHETVTVELPDDSAGYAAGLYAALHALDEAGVDRIVVDSPPDEPEWTAVWDRLRRAAAQR